MGYNAGTAVERLPMEWKRFELARSKELLRLREAVWKLRRQPRWVWCGAAGTTLVFVVLPLLSLILTTVCVFTLTFVVLIVGRRLAAVIPTIVADRPHVRSHARSTDPKVEILWPPYP
jgi:hypothetical protein